MNTLWSRLIRMGSQLEESFHTNLFSLRITHVRNYFFEACPKFDCTIREGTIFFIDVLNSK